MDHALAVETVGISELVDVDDVDDVDDAGVPWSLLAPPPAEVAEAPDNEAVELPGNGVV